MGNQETTRLYGDGRHPKGGSVTIRGQRLQVRFVGNDFQVDVVGIGTEIPLGIAEDLVRFRGLGVRYPGADPVDRAEQEAREEAKKNDDTVKRGEQKAGEAGGAREWPSATKAKQKLIEVAVSEGLRREDVADLEKPDIAEAIKVVYRKKFPEWAEQQDAEDKK